MSATPDENDEVTTTSGSPTMTNVVNQHGVDMDKVIGADKDAVCLIHITKNFHATTDFQNHMSHAIFAVIEKMARGKLLWRRGAHRDKRPAAPAAQRRVQADASE